ncbi:KTSC domain-containing protein [Mucilaginibacter terrigena]|uniref:KTSC domain-containing protein n=1 Tax=Mucilaginibacter terrigena TaxID=2492395 RepID=A0A4Q5LMB6_9SPHI|nr:KTSC domain-containing protein [Mucilaginibacter terrigena]RYU90806.1 KTSC domain-containing protein [Mucilaginibacter terrigena]
MRRQAVQSSALKSIGYNTEKFILELEFREGGVWQYFKFKPGAYKKFTSSESLGNFFVTKIKGKYREEKVGY